MPGLYLLDTNTVSYIIRGKNESVFRRLRAVPGGQILISVITEAELRFGLARRPEATNIATAVVEFLRRVHIVPWDSAAALHYADVRSAAERTSA
jgi:tRNA(fMet)-specific endonuclease VapC